VLIFGAFCCVFGTIGFAAPVAFFPGILDRERVGQ
jgi:hypothetical protein